MMIRKMSMAAAAGLAALVVATIDSTAVRAEVGRPAVTAVPCADRAWQGEEPMFEALPGAKASFGRYDGGVYRIEIPDKWNGDVVLWAHGFVDDSGAQALRLRAPIPGGGQGSGPSLREHMIANGFAWAASSFRCNGYVPGVGLLDTVALVDIVAKSAGRQPSRIYLSGGSMGGHITLLGMQEFPTRFAAGLAMCPAGPGEMDFLMSVSAASDVISGMSVTMANRDQGLARLSELYGKLPDLTPKGRQLASVQIETTGGPRPFALEGLAARFLENITSGIRIPTRPEWDSVATNAHVKYAIDETLGLTADALNARVQRKSIDEAARSHAMYDEVIPFDGRFERPVMTLHGTGDLYVPISLERTLKRVVDTAGKGQWLVQRIMRIPGHCGFSRQEQVQAFDDVVKWVREGARPQGDDVMGDLRDAGRRFTNPLRPGDPGGLKP
jgi:pimeloyl-ACP methyl ester carboxylesterase